VKQDFSSALRLRQLVLVALEALLFANEFVCVILFFGTAALAPSHWDLGLGWAVAPSAALMVLNSWALLWSAKTGYFVWLFGRWPREGVPSGLSQAEEHSLLAAGLAFDHGRFDKVPGLLARVPSERWLAGHWLGLGRSLALAGRMDDACPALEQGGAGPKVLRLFRPRRRLGMDQGPYFDAGMPARLRHIPGLAALALGLMLGSGTLAAALYGTLTRVGPLAPSFDETAFRMQVRGRFTVYYHDPVFRDDASALAEAALDHDLAFLGMPADTFGPGAVHLYLCDSQQEYRRRAPTHPSWEAACADPAETSVYIYRFPDQKRIFYEIVMAHEIGHLCYYRMAGSSPDDWLNEGLADYLGYDFGLKRAGIARQAWLQDNYFASLRSTALPFDVFFRTDPHFLPDAEVGTFYQQGFSVVYLLIEDYGRGPFLKFLRAYAGHKDINAALAGAFPTIPNIGALAAVWTLFYPRQTAAPAALASATPQI
jgi:hypothetical protein